jgi:hypothetical protein
MIQLLRFCRTATTTVTNQAIVFVSTISVEVTSTTTTSTASETQTLFETYTPVVTSTATLTITSGSAVTVTQYTPTAANVLSKRNLEERADSSIPAYASPCTAFTEYVAACSVAGVYGIATISSTLSATTIYVTAIATSTTTNIIVGTSSTTNVASATITNTLSTTSTLTADPSTLIATQTFAVAPATQTTTVPVPNFIIKMTPLKIVDSVLYMQKDPGDQQGLPATTDPSQATIWTIDTANHLVTADGNNIVTYTNSKAASYYYFAGNPVSLYQQYATSIQTPITCSINSTNLALACQTTSSVKIGYLQYRNKLFKWMHYNLATYKDTDQVNYPTYNATIVPV